MRGTKRRPPGGWSRQARRAHQALWFEHKGDFSKYWLDGFTWPSFVGEHFLNPLSRPAVTVTEGGNGLLFQIEP